MKIRSMTASFGKLQNETLTLREGLNVITAPNETGKSTWASFLLAMLYGIDSSERTTKTNLPAKAKYRPWSGAAMEGRMEVEWNDRRIAIERTGKARAPMSEFRAYDMDTMQPIAGMTGENCGEMLLGVGRSVFARSAFVAQGGAAVTPDAALEKRLSSLVTTGDERVSFTESYKQLNDWKNRCRHNKTGRLPEARAELDAAEQTLSQLHELHRGDLSLAAQQDALNARLAELSRIKDALRAQAAAQKQSQLRRAEQALADAQAARRQAERQTAALPAEDVLQSLNQELALLQLQARQLPEDSPEAPEKPDCPPVFAGLSEDGILPKAQRDAEQYTRLCAGKHRPAVPFILFAVLFLAIAVFAAIAGKPAITAAMGVLALSAIGVFFWMQRENRAREARLDEAMEIIKQYDGRSADEFVAYAAEYHEALLVYAHRKQSHDAQCAEQAARRQDFAAKQAALLGRVSMFAPQANTLPLAAQAIADAQTRYDACRAAVQNEQALSAQCAALRTAFGGMDAVPAAPAADTTGYDEVRVEQQLAQVTRELSSVRSKLDLSRGRADALGDPARLSARCEALRAEIDALEQRYAALELAQQTLDEANSALQTRFAPQLASLAGTLLAQLTDNRYDAVLLDRDLHAEARPAGEMITRQLLSLSGGTVDQVYLAVRLAICRLALGADAPLVLDDALVHFDDARLAAAMRLLQQESRTRQVLLFTCQGREQAALDAM